MDNLKIGDTVIWYHGLTGKQLSVIKITGETKTMWKCKTKEGLENRFRKDTLSEVGADRFYSGRIEKASEEKIEEVRFNNFKRKCVNFIINPEKITKENEEEIRNFINKYKIGEVK